MKRIAYDHIIAFAEAVLAKAGVEPYSANAVAAGLGETSLRGVDSHGVRLLPHYVRSVESGRKNPRPNFVFERRFPALGTLRADHALGLAAGAKAIDHCMDMAEVYGLGAVAVVDSSHAGAMAASALRAAKRGYIALAFTHADSFVVPYDGIRPYFGTNPICMAAPRVEEDPFCLDMATSTIAWNKVLAARAQAAPLGPGQAADESGAETTDAFAAASLLPSGAYKGYGLGAMVEVFSGILTGMGFGPTIPAMYTAPMDQPRRLGQFYMALRIDSCVDAESFRHSLQQMTDAVRAEPAKPGEDVMLAGDPEIRCARERRLSGIPLDSEIEAGLGALAEKYGVELPLR